MMASFSSSGKSAGTIPDVSMLFISSKNPTYMYIVPQVIDMYMYIDTTYYVVVYLLVPHVHQ